MLQLTVIANIPSSELHMNFDGKPATRLIAQLLSGNPNATSVPRLQVASLDFKERLPLMDVIGNRAYPLKQYFAQIPDNHHFLVLPGHIDDQIQIYQCTKYLAEIDGVPLVSQDLEKIAPYLYEHYEVRTFKGDERLKVGIYEKSKRVCRFCGHSVPDVHFKEKSHAISESLGNKGLICLEECDECNHRFNETIEQDITNLFHFQLLLQGVKGKNGDPTLKGDDVSIYKDSSSRETIGRDTLVFKVKTMPETRDPQEIAKFLSQQFSFSNSKYIPQNIYKCFCKYVLSLIDSKQLPYFQDTIKWINEPLSKHRLPTLWYYEVPMGSTPSLVIILRKHNHKEIPYCWAILNIANTQFIFIVPFCSNDKYKFVGKSRIDYFLEGLKNMMPNISLKPLRLDGIKPFSVKVDAHFEIPPECVERRDYYWIKKE